MLSVNFSPFPLIETERLLLRPLSKDDALAFFRLRNNEQVLSYLDRDPEDSIEETKRKMDEIFLQQQNNEGIMWVITLKQQPENMIGTIGYWRLIKGHFRAEIGYLLHPDHWKKGIMKEALNKVIHFGFNEMNLHSIEANVNPNNEASTALLESCGFIKEAYFRENYYYKGHFFDSVIYSRLNK